MKRIMSIVAAAVIVGGLGAAVAFAEPGGWGPGGRGPMMGPGYGPMGGGRMAMMQGRGPGAWGQCPGMAGVTGTTGAPEATATVTEDKAKELATAYAATYFKGYTIERVLPFQGRFHTAYQVELKGPNGEKRVLHVNPWGGVRPFGPLAASE